ncbi:hypothetical protein C0995_007374 [Termitomyces sp. Mi166|nr:hypothetical protein C0995_007374 [Termitomyces sp. Mi166\
MNPTSSVPTPSLFSLKGKNVLLTGGTRGIGAACAVALAEAGASICLVQRNSPDGTPPNHETLNAIRALGAVAQVVYCDLDNMEAVKGLFQLALDHMGGQIHILVNCAGIQRRSPSLDFSESDWDDVINTNLKSGGLTVPAYASAKGALGQLTKALSNEWSQHNVQVNAICPGYIATDMNEKLLADPVRLRQISERIPAGRWGEPKDFAGPVVFLASDASQYVCGELLVVDGGWMGR